MGFFIEGLFITAEIRPDGITYILIACGTSAYRVKFYHIDSALLCSLSVGDPVTACIRPIVYNGKLYFSGDNILKGGILNGEC